jgi:hypothetical protein
VIWQSLLVPSSNGTLSSVSSCFQARAKPLLTYVDCHFVLPVRCCHGRAVLSVDQPDDEDDVEMLAELRVAILEAYTGVAQGFAPAAPECGECLAN